MMRRRPVVISNEIRMKRSLHAGAFLVVEGRDDRLFCERYLDPSCNLVVGEGKESVQEVIRILDDADFRGVVGIVDADFDALEGLPLPSDNLVQVDAHDLEVALVRSPALDRVLVELASREKIQAVGTDVRTMLLDAASPIGYLRWLSVREGLALRFADLNLSPCVDFQTLTLDTQCLIALVKNHSQRPGLDARELELGMKSLAAAAHDKWQVCCGTVASQQIRNSR